MRARTIVLLLCSASPQFACDDSRPRAPLAPAAAATSSAPTALALDGRFDDWRGDAAGASIAALADADFLWIHAKLDRPINLQGAEFTTTLSLDLDARADTGRLDDGIGADLDVALSPPSPTAKSANHLLNGLVLRAHDDAASSRDVSHAACQFAFAPTFAATEFEFRVARRTSLGAAVDDRFAHAERARGRITVADASGHELFRSSVFDAPLPASRARSPDPAPTVAQKADGAVRVLSWNVQKDSPAKNPAPFARVFRALDPDIYLLQEWQASSETLAAWFAKNVPSQSPWHVASFEDLGVAIVSRFPAVELEGARLAKREVVAGHQTPMRSITALIDSPIGPLIACSVHLKCCGAMGTWEDECRKIEARAINDELRRALVAHADARVVASGDFNLVGTRDPLDLLRAGLDRDGTDLDPIVTPVLGDAAIYTWADDQSEFAPGRLDWCVTSDSTTDAANAFVLDTARIPAATLAAVGIEPGDSSASDHRTLVVDLRRKAAGGGSTAAAAPALESITGPALLARVQAAKRPVLLNFWASWCTPCVAELPDLLRVRREFAERGLEVWIVSCDAPAQRDAAIRQLTKLGVDFPTCIKEGKDAEFIDAIASEWNGTLPLTIGFDALGKKSVVHEGQASYDDFRGFAERLLAPATGSSGN